MDGIRTRWLHIVKFLLIFSFFFVISLPLPFSRLRPRRRSPWSSAAIRFLFFLLHPSSSLAKEGGASGCRHGPWPLVLGWGGVGGSGSKLFQVPRAAPSVFTCVVLNKPALLRAVEPPRAGPSPQAWTLHPAWRQCRALWLWELPPAPLAPVLLEASFTFYFNPNV